jgi:hypothetical protein
MSGHWKSAEPRARMFCATPPRPDFPHRAKARNRDRRLQINGLMRTRCIEAAVDFRRKKLGGVRIQLERGVLRGRLLSQTNRTAVRGHPFRPASFERKIAVICRAASRANGREASGLSMYRRFGACPPSRCKRLRLFRRLRGPRRRQHKKARSG